LPLWFCRKNAFWVLLPKVLSFVPWLVDYCSVFDVKPVLHIDSAETSEDAELADCVTSSSDRVFNLLKVADLVVPVVVPQSVKDATKFFAAWQYRRRRDPEGAQVFYYDAQETLRTYIDAELAALAVANGEPYVGTA
jgi:hypothetical protein